MSAPTTHTLETYKLFVGLAIVGLQREADALARREHRRLNRVASYLRRQVGLPLQVLYRGIIISPGEITGGVLTQDLGFTYQSATEDIEVACWFADVDADISQLAITRKNNPTGYIGIANPASEEILFHHSWTDYLNHTTPGRNIYELLQQTLPPETARELLGQFKWHSAIQKEVLVKPSVVFYYKSIEDYGCPGTQTLDNKFRPRPDFIMSPEGLQHLGVPPGVRLNIISAHFPILAELCPVCRTNGIDTIYFLDTAHLLVMKCVNCKQFSWAQDA